MKKTDKSTPESGAIEIAHQFPDKLTKASLQIKEAIIDLLKNFVHPSVTKGLDYDALALDNTTYISPAMKALYSDVVYRTTCNAEVNVSVAVLVEHKTRMELYPHLQLLDYKGAIWRHDEANENPLTVVIGIVLYQNKYSYTKKDFHKYFVNVPPHLKQFIPRFKYILINVSKISDKEILALAKDSILRSLLLAYKHASDNAYVKKHFQEFFRFFEGNPHLEYYFQQMLVYVKNYADISPSEMRALIQTFNNSHLKEKAMSTYDQIISLGKVESDIRVVKRLLLKGLTIVEIADFTDLPIEDVKKYIEHIEKDKIVVKKKANSNKK